MVGRRGDCDVCVEEASLPDPEWTRLAGDGGSALLCPVLLGIEDYVHQVGNNLLPWHVPPGAKAKYLGACCSGAPP